MRIAPTWFLVRGLWGGGSSLRGGGQIGVPENFLMINKPAVYDKACILTLVVAVEQIKLIPVC